MSTLRLTEIKWNAKTVEPNVESTHIKSNDKSIYKKKKGQNERIKPRKKENMFIQKPYKSKKHFTETMNKLKLT